MRARVNHRSVELSIRNTADSRRTASNAGAKLDEEHRGRRSRSAADITRSLYQKAIAGWTMSRVFYSFPWPRAVRC